MQDPLDPAPNIVFIGILTDAIGFAILQNTKFFETLLLKGAV